MVKLVTYGSLTRSDNAKDRYVQVREAQLHDLLRAMLTSIEVDERWYRNRYRDIDAAINSGKIESARAHYINVGYFENRIPRQFTVDPDWYLMTYSDVKHAIQESLIRTAQDHFENAGYKEGRKPYENWSL